MHIRKQIAYNVHREVRVKDMIHIEEGNAHLSEIKMLIKEYSSWLGRDLSFQGLKEELEHLEELYVLPQGRCLIALDDQGKAAGCIAYHRHDARRCEMKRLYVRKAYRGQRIGFLLIRQLLLLAKADGYEEMVLDTIAPLHHAIELYKQFHFTPCAAYYHNPMKDVLYMRKILKEDAGSLLQQKEERSA